MEKESIEAAYKLCGDKPRALDILIPVEDEELYCQQYYRKYSATQGLVCKGTGETARVKVDTSTGAYADHNTKEFVYKEISCPGKECAYYKNKTCKEVMNLQFMLPKIPGLGVWQIDSGSANSIININSCAAMIRGLFGRLHMIPLLLTLESKEVNNPDTGKRQTVFVLNLRHQGNLYDIMNEVKVLQASLGTTMLPPAPDEDEEPDPEAVLELEAPPADPTGAQVTPAPPPAPAPAKPESLPGAPIELPDARDMKNLATVQEQYKFSNKTVVSLIPKEWNVRSRTDLTRKQLYDLIKLMEAEYGRLKRAGEVE